MKIAPPNKSQPLKTQPLKTQPGKQQPLFSESARRDWAQGLLGLSADAPAEAVRAGMLARLEVDDFMPPPPVRQALGILSGQPQKPARPHSSTDTAAPTDVLDTDRTEDRIDPFEDDVENRLMDDIEEFARKFFEQECPQRRQRWTELSAKARPFARLRMRLASLMAGLDIAAIVPKEDPKAEILARRLMMLFVLLPAQQESVRQQWVREMKTTGPWKSAVRKFRARYSRLAQLEPDLLTALEIMESTEPRRIATQSVIPGIVSRPKAKVTTRQKPAGAHRLFTGAVIAAWSLVIMIVISQQVQRSTFTPAKHSSPNEQGLKASEELLRNAKLQYPSQPSDNSDATPFPANVPLTPSPSHIPGLRDDPSHLPPEFVPRDVTPKVILPQGIQP